MKKKMLVGLIASLLWVFFCFLSFGYAATVVLKSGKTVEGKIIKKTDEYIKLDIQGVSTVYYFNEVENIDGKPFDNFKTDIIPGNTTKVYYGNGNLGVETSGDNGKQKGATKVYIKNGNLGVETSGNDGKQGGSTSVYLKY